MKNGFCLTVVLVFLAATFPGPARGGDWGAHGGNQAYSALASDGTANAGQFIPRMNFQSSGTTLGLAVMAFGLSGKAAAKN